MPFYVVFLPDSTGETVKDSFPTFQDALKEAKKHKDARIKKFSSEGEISDFLNRSVENSTTPSRNLDSKIHSPDIGSSKEKLPFPSLSSQNLVEFRKIIEIGDAKRFLNCIWSNPRYLISSGDSPTILKEGPRYNALHVIALKNQPILCKLLLSSICDEKFMMLMYPDAAEFWHWQINHLLDLYLNMPEKGLYETPLHFASKFGHPSVVKVLVAYNCDKERLNKNNMKACDIICSRNPVAGKGVQEAIADMLGVLYYVPVVVDKFDSSATNLEPPRLFTDLSIGHHNYYSKDKLSAIAGPMSPQKACDFYKEWKSAKKQVSPVQRCSNFEMKPESIGRHLAKENNVSWYEFWPFLNKYCDIASSEGLIMFEAYLQDKLKEVNNNSSIFVAPFSHDQSDSKSESPCNNASSPCLPLSPDVTKSPLSDLCNRFKKLRLNESGDFHPNQNISRVLTVIGNMVSGSILAVIGEEVPPHKCYPNKLDDFLVLCHDDHTSIASECHQHHMNTDSGVSLQDIQYVSASLSKTDSLHCILECIISLVTEGSLSSSCHSALHPMDTGDDEEDDYLTPPSSPEIKFGTPTEGPDLYVSSKLSDCDLELLNIIDSLDINADEYPYISYWESSVKRCRQKYRSWDKLGAVAQKLDFADDAAGKASFSE